MSHSHSYTQVAKHAGPVIDPDHRDSVPFPHTVESVSKFISRYLKGVSTTPSVCGPCLYSESSSLSLSLSIIIIILSLSFKYVIDIRDMRAPHWKLCRQYYFVTEIICGTIMSHWVYIQPDQ